MTQNCSRLPDSTLRPLSYSRPLSSIPPPSQIGDLTLSSSSSTWNSPRDDFGDLDKQERSSLSKGSTWHPDLMAQRSGFIELEKNLTKQISNLRTVVDASLANLSRQCSQIGHQLAELDHWVSDADKKISIEKIDEMLERRLTAHLKQVDTSLATGRTAVVRDVIKEVGEEYTLEGRYSIGSDGLSSTCGEAVLAKEDEILRKESAMMHKEEQLLRFAQRSLATNHAMMHGTASTPRHSPQQRIPSTASVDLDSEDVDVATSRYAGAETRMQDAALRAMLDDNIGHLRQILDDGFDPNFEYEDITVHHRRHTHCSMVAMAALMRHPFMIELLLERRADPNSTYGFIAGATHMRCTFSACFIPVNYGHVSLLSCLIDGRADPDIKSSNNANLVWQAAYSGHVSVLHYLLALKVNPKIAAKHQDFKNVTFAPLHVAVTQGHASCIRPLIEARAHVNEKNENGTSPFLDAIRYCHPLAVCYLVSGGADLESVVASDDASCTALQLLIQQKNPVLARAVAVGLQDQPDRVERLAIDEVVMLLRSPGHTKRELLRALFSERQVRYRDAAQGIHVMQTAFLGHGFGQSKGSVPVFPHVVSSKFSFSDLETIFRDRMVPDEKTMKFIKNLCPQRGEHEPRSYFSEPARDVPIKIFECLVPNIDRVLVIMELLTKCEKFDDIWLEMHCQAIFRRGWIRVKPTVVADVVCQFLLLTVFFAISVLYNEYFFQVLFYTGTVGDYARVVAICGLPLWLYECCIEILELLAYTEGGSKVVMDFIQDSIRLGADGFLLACFCLDFINYNVFWFRIWFAGCCFFKWTKVVYTLAPFRNFGFHVLPILFAISDIGHFLVILIFYLLGLGHGLVASDFLNEHVSFAFLDAFSYGILGDPTRIQKIFHPDPQPHNFRHFCVLVLILLAGVAVPITLMNIFIAALCDSYARGILYNEQLYQSALAQTVRSRSAVQIGMSRLLCMAKDSQYLPDPDHPHRTIERLWYCAENQVFKRVGD